MFWIIFLTILSANFLFQILNVAAIASLRKERAYLYKRNHALRTTLYYLGVECEALPEEYKNEKMKEAYSKAASLLDEEEEKTRATIKK
jgi:hypothetical protein